MMPSSNIVAFKQNAEFYYKRAMSRRDEGSTLEALALFRRACAEAPNNLAYAIEYAQTYSDIGYFELSNEILTPFFNEDIPLNADFYYLVGFNYTAMQAFGLAVYCFDHYLDITGEASDYEGTEILFDVLDNNSFYELEDVLDDQSAMLQDAINHNMNLVVNGQVDKAMKNLQKLKQSGKFDGYELDNTIAMAHFCNNEYEKALEICESILAQNPHNIQVLCQKILICINLKDTEKIDKAIEAIAALQITDASANVKAGLMYCELDRYEEATKHFALAAAAEPYDVNILHFYSFSLFQRKLYPKALELWTKVHKLIPNNYIAAYYAATAQKASNGEGEGETNIYFQIPAGEVSRISLEPEQLQALSKEERLRLLTWACKYTDAEDRQIAMRILLEEDFDFAKRTLGAMLLCPDVGMEQIKLILAELERVDPRVYCVASEESIDKVTLQQMGQIEFSADWDLFCDDVRQKLLMSMNGRVSEQSQVEKVLETWEKFKAVCLFVNIASMEKDADLFAASVEYFVRGHLLCEATQVEITKEYDVSVYRMRKVYTFMKQAYEMFGKIGEQIYAQDPTMDGALLVDKVMDAVILRSLDQRDPDQEETDTNQDE